VANIAKSSVAEPELQRDPAPAPITLAPNLMFKIPVGGLPSLSQTAIFSHFSKILAGAASK
jgi:hypothetical protein